MKDASLVHIIILHNAMTLERDTSIGPKDMMFTTNPSQIKQCVGTHTDLVL